MERMSHFNPGSDQCRHFLDSLVCRGLKNIVTMSYKVTEFKSEDRCDLRGCTEAAMASEATPRECLICRSDMHMNTVGQSKLFHYAS